MRHVIATSVLAISLWLFAAAPRADETGTWQYQCLGGEFAGSIICTTELATFEDGQEYVFYFVRAATGPSPFVVAGEDESLSAATITVDDNDPVTTESCEDGACFFGNEESELLLGQFRKGQSAHVTMRSGPQGVMFDQPLTLRGFSAAYAQSAP